ncbi:phage minor head protein [Aeoliella sp.]|uniref:phage minor head protein n=1 Tax=Aeoliella sp. TaxID=2795800 RepID=UPI003CCBF0E5
MAPALKHAYTMPRQSVCYQSLLSCQGIAGAMLTAPYPHRGKSTSSKVVPQMVPRTALVPKFSTMKRAPFSVFSTVGEQLSNSDATSNPQVTGSNPVGRAKKIREELGGTMARRRALRISRTETSSAMNSGHDSVYQQLEQDGSIRGKHWLAIADDDVRHTHIDNDGVVVRAAESFQVGGFSAPWPGHWSLPAQERVHCRCTTIALLT